MTVITERVAKGAEYLDKHDPGWWRQDIERPINLDRLNLQSGDSCVLGQRCPLELLDDSLADVTKYEAYGSELSGLDGDEMDAWAAEHGFQTTPDGFDTYESLTREWKRVIRERRAA